VLAPPRAIKLSNRLDDSAALKVSENAAAVCRQTGPMSIRLVSMRVPFYPSGVEPRAGQHYASGVCSEARGRAIQMPVKHSPVAPLLDLAKNGKSMAIT